jgi:hypothetical protein
MMEEIVEYVARCDMCQRVKAEHQRPASFLQPLEMPTWKWDDISMDFVVGLMRTQRGHDAIWVIVDRLTNVAQFILVWEDYRVLKLVDLYIEHILRLHRVPHSIVFD